MGFWSRILGRRDWQFYGWTPTTNVVPANIAELPAVVRCVSLIASDVARCPLVATDSSGNQHDDTTLGLLHGSAWGETLTGTDLRRWLAAECLTTGNAFAAIITDSQGQPIGLRPLVTSAVALEIDTDGNFHWTYQSNEFDYSGVLHWKALPTPGNPYWGTSPISAASTTLNALAALEGSYAAFAKSGGIGKLGFSHPGGIKPEIRDAMRTAFMAQHGSAASLGAPIFIGEGMKLEQVAPTMASDLNTLRGQATREIASLYGVPSAYLDASDARTQPEIAQLYVSACLATWSESWCAELTAKLAAPGRRISLDFSPVTQGDFRTAGRAYAQLCQIGAISPNDVRRRLGFAPWPGLDEPKPVISGVTPMADQAAQGDSNA
jgi:HK97 family phage portal protein